MKKSIPILVLLICLVILGTVVIAFLNLDYPRVGHDYSLIIPSILDNSIYFRNNGLSIEWYTPSFGGGIPVYPDPSSAAFSLPALLTSFLSPWAAMIVSTLVYILVGGVTAYYFLKKVLNLHWTSSILGTIFFIASGFYMQRIAVGHLVYQTFPLFPLFLIALMDNSLPKWMAGLLLALVTSWLVYSAGYSMLIIFGFSLLLVFPLLYIFRPGLFSFSRLFSILAVGGAVALILSASKLAAVYSFMRYFPRLVSDSYQTTIWSGLLGIVMQLLGTMTIAPLVQIMGGHAGLLDLYMYKITGAHYGYWEFDMSLSPVVFVILITGLISGLLHIKRNIKKVISNKRWIALVVLMVFTWLTVEFILAKGLIYPLLKELPLLSSLRTNPRFTAAFIFPLTLLAALFIDRWVARLSLKKSVYGFLILTIITLLPLSLYFLIGSDLQWRIYDISTSFSIYNSIQSGDPMTVTEVDLGTSNTDALLLNTSNLGLYDPIFGSHLEYFHPEVHPGSVWEVTDGYYNMTNPSGLVFPEINDTRAFERIKVGDEDNMEAFINHKQPHWKIPLYQQVLDWVSGITFLAVLSAFLIFGTIMVIPLFRQRKIS